MRYPAALSGWKLSAASAIIATLLAVSAAATEIATVMRVTDGDTLTATIEGRPVTVRLAGIDAPETSKGRDAGQPFAQKARSYLAERVLNRRVQIRSLGYDRYGRTLAEVFRNGANINLEMVSAGLAEVYRGRPAPGLNLESYRRAEVDARSRRREMWGQGEKYLSPQSWRRHDRPVF
jgi:micrococcal nuclease